MGNVFTRLRFWWRFRKKFFRCPKCGYTWPKKGTLLSGFPEDLYGLHVHCPKCGEIVAKHVEKSEVA
jgi:ssDNA-binding Zn-finger/Zn-ribbon topoisomerase 1